jgi:hypothetical protein
MAQVVEEGPEFKPQYCQKERKRRKGRKRRERKREGSKIFPLCEFMI